MAIIVGVNLTPVFWLDPNIHPFQPKVVIFRGVYIWSFTVWQKTYTAYVLITVETPNKGRLHFWEMV